MAGKCTCTPKRHSPMTVKVKKHVRDGGTVKVHKRHNPK